MKKVRFGIIGLGVVGGRHVRTFQGASSREFALTAAAESNPQTARSAARGLDVPIFSSPDEGRKLRFLRPLAAFLCTGQ